MVFRVMCNVHRKTGSPEQSLAARAVDFTVLDLDSKTAQPVLKCTVPVP